MCEGVGVRMCVCVHSVCVHVITMKRNVCIAPATIHHMIIT